MKQKLRSPHTSRVPTPGSSPPMTSPTTQVTRVLKLRLRNFTRRTRRTRVVSATQAQWRGILSLLFPRWPYMHARTRDIGIAATLLAGLSALTARGAANRFAQAASSASGGTLVVNSAYAFTSKDADPARGGVDFTAVPVFHAMYDTLLTFANNDYTKPVPSLATGYTVSDAGKKFTFTLRKGVTFSNGDPLTAADVVFSFLRLQNIEDTPSYLMDGVTSVTAPNSS